MTCSRQRPAFPRHVHMPGTYVGPSRGTSACLWSFLEGDTCLSLLFKKATMGVGRVGHTVISWCVVLVLMCACAHARPQRDRPVAASAKQRVAPQPSAHAEDSLTPLRTVGRSTLFSSQLFQVLQAPLGPLGHNTKEAEHKKLWPLNWEDVVGFFVAAVGLFIAAGGGLGGGGVLVPVYILLLGAC